MMFDREKRFRARRERDPHGVFSDNEINADIDRQELVYDIEALPDHPDPWCDLKSILRRIAERER